MELGAGARAALPATPGGTYDGAAARLQCWQQEPAGWLAASEAAVRRARAFGPAHIEAIVDRWLMPEVRA